MSSVSTFKWVLRANPKGQTQVCVEGRLFPTDFTMRALLFMIPIELLGHQPIPSHFHGVDVSQAQVSVVGPPVFSLRCNQVRKQKWGT